MKPVIAHLFPLTIYKSKILISDDEKETLVKEVYEMEKKSANPEYKANNRAWTGDTQGHEYLYKNPKFFNLFKQIETHVKKYLGYLSLDANRLDLYFQRAWATISRNFENINFHNHAQSHISFAYYLKKNKNDGSLNFHNEVAQNEIVSKIFQTTPVSSQSDNFFKVNYDNAKFVNIYPEVDELYIFPSKTTHSTSENKTTFERISISADVSIVTKHSKNLEHLLTPIDNWMKF